MLSDGFLKQKGRPALRAWHRHSGALAAQEALYASMIDRGARSLGIELPPLYPHRSAANWGLLYCLFRIATETPCRRILELGAGQSTFLLNAIARTRDLKVVTLEGKAEWADLVAERIEQRVIHAPLQRRDVKGIEVDGFDPDVVDGVFDLIVIDGPFGKPRHSRRTALEFLDTHLGEEFAVVFDDAERRGERDTLEAFRESPVGQRADWSWVHGEKDQCLFFTPDFSLLRYL